jgi:hypothetical protein
MVHVCLFMELSFLILNLPLLLKMNPASEGYMAAP